MDYCKYRTARREADRRLFRKARAWINSNDQEWPYSFRNLCEAISVSADSLRGTLLEASDADHQRTVKRVGKLLDAGRS